MKQNEIQMHTTEHDRRNLHMMKRLTIGGKTYEVVSVLPFADETKCETAVDKLKYLIGNSIN